MTKLELAKQLAKAEGISHAKAVSIIENLLDLIVCHFQGGWGRVDGEPITLRGFGTFKIRKRRAFTGTDPRNGQDLAIPERKSLVFKPASETLRRIN